MNMRWFAFTSLLLLLPALVIPAGITVCACEDGCPCVKTMGKVVQAGNCCKDQETNRPCKRRKISDERGLGACTSPVRPANTEVANQFIEFPGNFLAGMTPETATLSRLANSAACHRGPPRPLPLRL